jgi:outer membrane protein assembly factor BamE
MKQIAAVILFLLSGCSLTAHKINVQQGNYVDQAMVDKLKPEMTRSQVRFVLGTPLVADAFHPNRWEYVFLAGKAGDVQPLSRISVVFDGDKLVRIEGAVAPKEKLTQAANSFRRQ